MGNNGAFTLPDTDTDTDTEKNGLYKIVWRCSHCTETTMLLSTVAIYRSWCRCRAG